jgi:hypothetical protein
LPFDRSVVHVARQQIHAHDCGWFEVWRKVRVDHDPQGLGHCYESNGPGEPFTVSPLLLHGDDQGQADHGATLITLKFTVRTVNAQQHPGQNIPWSVPARMSRVGPVNPI